MNERIDLVATDALPAAFESVCLIQCTDIGRLPGRRRPAWYAGHTPSVPPPADALLAEFNREDAAARLAGLLGGLGFAASREAWTGGGRRRYSVHRVLVPQTQASAAGSGGQRASAAGSGGQRAAATRLLSAAWRQGRRELLSTDPIGASSPRNAQRAVLARVAWRAALLAGGRRLRADFLGVRLGDQEMAAALVRAARLLGVTAAVVQRPGCLLVTVSDVDGRARILGTLNAAASWVPQRRAPVSVPLLASA